MVHIVIVLVARVPSQSSVPDHEPLKHIREVDRRLNVSDLDDLVLDRAARAEVLVRAVGALLALVQVSHDVDAVVSEDEEPFLEDVRALFVFAAIFVLLARHVLQVGADMDPRVFEDALLLFRFLVLVFVWNLEFARVLRVDLLGQQVNLKVVLVNIVLQRNSDASVFNRFQRLLDEGLPQRLLLEDYGLHH